MEIKILQVFYDKNGLPYKDKERTVHYPITSGTFLGASNTTQIRFYYDKLDELNESTFVAISKLPNGKIGSEILESEYDSELQENYAVLNLSQFYTQYKGDVFISLQGYQGGVRVEQDEDGIYQIYGTPTIQTTGSIKLSIAYAPTFIGSGQTENVTLQRVLAELSTKLGIRQETLHVEELPIVGNPNVWYVVNDDPNDPTKANIYIWNAVTQTYVWVGDNTLDLGNYYTQEQGEQFESDIDNRVTSVENELSSVASGSPKGVYATLSDLETAYPTGTTGIYVVSASGHWYYWNGNTWTDGGVYQASEIGDNSVFVESLNDVTKLVNQLEYKFDDNLFTTEDCIDGQFYQYDGALITNTSVSCTKLIDIKDYTKLLFCLYDYNQDVIPHQVTFWDENGQYMQGYQTTTERPNYSHRIELNVFSASNNYYCEIEIPRGCKYVRVAYVKAFPYKLVALYGKKENIEYKSQNVFTTDNAEIGGYYDAINYTYTWSTTSGVATTKKINVEGYDYIEFERKTTDSGSTTHQWVFRDENDNVINLRSIFKTFIVIERNTVYRLPIPKNAKTVQMAYLSVSGSAIDSSNGGYYSMYLCKYDSKFSGKQINCLGDSITYGYIPDSGAQMSNPYPKQLNDYLGIKMSLNYGISGSTLAVNSGYYDPMSVRYANMDDNADIVLVFGGTNDYGRAVYSQLGTFGDTTNTTVYGALDVLCNGLITKYPKANIFFLTPLHRGDRTGPNGAGYTLEDVTNAIKQVCAKYSIPVLDLFTIGQYHPNIVAFNSIYGGNDKLHPNQLWVTEHLTHLIGNFIYENFK